MLDNKDVEMDVEDDGDMVLFDQTDLLTNRIKSKTDVHGSYKVKFLKTLALCSAFFGLGLCFAVVGPTLLDLKNNVNTDISRISYVFTGRSLGYLLGSIIGGILFDRFNQLLLLSFALFITSVVTALMPWSSHLIILAGAIGIQGLTMGFLDTGGNVLCLTLWGRKSGPFMQALHFAFGIGAFISPLIAEPFLVQDSCLNNTLQTQTLQFSISSLTTSHIQKREVRDDNFNYSTSLNISLINETTSALHYITPSDLEFNFSSEFVTNDTKITTIVVLPTTPQLSKATPKAKKPKPKTDGKYLNRDTESEPLWNKPLAKPSVPTTTLTSVIQKTNSTSNIPILLLKNNVNSSNSLLKIYTTVSNLEHVTLPSVGNENLTNTFGNHSETNPVNPTVFKPFNVSEDNLLISNSTNVSNITDISEGNRHGSSITVQSNDVTNITVITTSLPPSILDFPLSNSTNFEVTTATAINKARNTIGNKNVTQPSSRKVDDFTKLKHKSSAKINKTLKSSKHVTTSSVFPGTNLSLATAKIAHKTSLTTVEDLRKTSIMETVSTTSNLVSNSSDLNTSETIISSLVPLTTMSSFSLPVTHLFTDKADLKNSFAISHIQFAYLIIAVIIFQTSIAFLVFFGIGPHNLRALVPFDHENESDSYSKSTLRVQLLILLFIFYFMYVGMEATFGGLVLTFSLCSKLHFSKSLGAYVTSLFWGMFALARGFAIYFSKYLSSSFMLRISLSISLFASVILVFFGETNTWVLWIGSGLLGIGMASIFPTGITWVEQYIDMNNKEVSVLVVGSALGEMVLPVVTTHFFNTISPMFLMYLILSLNLVSFIIYIIMERIADGHGDKYGFLHLNIQTFANRRDKNFDDDKIEKESLLENDVVSDKIENGKRAFGHLSPTGSKPKLVRKSSKKD